MTASTYAQLHAEINRLMIEAERLKRRESREARDVLKRIRQAVAAYGFTEEDVFGEEPRKVAKKKGRKKQHRPGWPAGEKRPIKYRDAAGNTWSGMGSVPRWLRAHLAEGHSIEEFSVQQAA